MAEKRHVRFINSYSEFVLEQDRRALVVEDEDDLRTLIVDVLGHAGFAVESTSSGRSGVQMARELDPDLVTLDLGLPDLDGVEVCRQLREHTDAYVIMLSAPAEEIDRLIGLETGADDYLTTPFSPRELRTRAMTMMRRSRHNRSEWDPALQLRIGDLQVDRRTRVALLAGKELELTRTEFDLLATLLGNPRRVWSRDALYRQVWSTDWVGDGHLVEVHMGNLRRKLGDDSRSGRFVRTVRGVGYRLGNG